MYEISATKLKENLNQVLKDVQKEHVVIRKYRKPQAVIISYQDWLLLQVMKSDKKTASKNTTGKARKAPSALDKFKHLIGDWGETDSEKLVREMRDED